MFGTIWNEINGINVKRKQSCKRRTLPENEQKDHVMTQGPLKGGKLSSALLLVHVTKGSVGRATVTQWQPGLKPHLCLFLKILDKLFNLFDPYCCHQQNTGATFVKTERDGLFVKVKHHENGIYYLASSIGGARSCWDTGKERPFLQVLHLSSSPPRCPVRGSPEAAGK